MQEKYSHASTNHAIWLYLLFKLLSLEKLFPAVHLTHQELLNTRKYKSNFRFIAPEFVFFIPITFFNTFNL